MRSHSCFLLLINHRLRLNFSKDCRSSYHKPQWCLQGFLQHDHSWLQYKYTRGAKGSKFQFAQMTAVLPALTKEHGHDAYPIHPSHHQIFISGKHWNQTPPWPMWTVPSKHSPKRFSIGLPLTFPIIHLVKPQSQSQHFPLSSKIMCTSTGKEKQEILTQSFNFLLISSKPWWFYNGCCYPAKMAITPLPHTIQSLFQNSCTPFTFLLT